MKVKQVPFSRKKPFGAHLEVAGEGMERQLHVDERVDDWRRDRFRDDRGDAPSRARYECGRLILTPGPWARVAVQDRLATARGRAADAVLVRPRRRPGAFRARSVSD